MKLVSEAKLADMFAKVEERGRTVMTVEMSARTFARLRDSGPKPTEETYRWGAEVWVVPWIRQDWVALTDETGRKTFHEFVLHPEEAKAAVSQVLDE